MKPKALRLFLLFSFFLFSFFRNSIPPLMTTIQEVFLITISVSAIVPAVFIAGFIFASVIAALIIAKIGIRVSILSGTFSAMSGCLLCIVARQFILFNIGIFISGMAFGWGMLSLTTSYAYLDVKIQNFGLLHACFGLGGIFAPLFISLILTVKIDFKGIFLLYLILFTVLSIYILITKTPENTKYTTYSFKNIFSPFKNIKVLSCIFIIFFYSGCEIGMVTWAGNLFEDFHHYSKEISVLFITLFWIFFTLGRLITDFLYFKLGKIKLVFIICFPGLVVLLLLTVAGKIGSVILFSLSAFILAPFFPAVQKYANSLIPKKEIGLLNGLIYIFAGVSVLLLTSVMGVVAERSVRSGFVVPVAGILLILITFIFGILRFRKKKKNKTI